MPPGCSRSPGPVSSQTGTGGVLTTGAGVTIQSGATVATGKGDITLSAGGAAALDLVISSAISSSSDLDLSALRDIIIDGTIQTSSGASITLTADSDDTGGIDAGGVWVKGGGIH